MKARFKLSSLQFLVIGFALMILLGALLLSLPIASRDGNGIPFLNAMFTSTSASCVTGLVVYDTYTQFSLFGQAVILILIQIGGLGFMMVAIMFSMFIGRRISLRERSLLMESVSLWKLGGVVRMTKKVLTVTAIFELGGTLVLATRFCPQFGFLPGLWSSLFHSVSAFCNSGFDLMGKIAPFSSLTSYSGDAVVNITIMVLVVTGGLGFFIWDDLTAKKWHFSRYQLHSKIMITATLFLIVFPAVLFYLLEESHAFSGMDTGERILASFFHSITPRTAGFNTVPITSLSSGGQVLSMILMLIGAGPGSTGGGMKVTTVVVIVLAVVARARNRNELNIFSRRLEEDARTRATSSAGFYLMLSVAGWFILCLQGFSVADALFESLSALGTVGLSTGITTHLSAVSRIAIMLLMYSGRVGSLSVAMALAKRRETSELKNISEKIIVG